MHEEALISYLRSVYEGAGFRSYKMRKFEEYSLYLENRDFLLSDFVITFSDLSGRLLALKPDVTLSIVKGSRATKEKGEKLHYLENVYRLDARTHEYREIRQMGLEALGDIDDVQTLEICILALKSLLCVNKDGVMDISHMGYLGALLKGTDGKRRADILSALRGKSAWALEAALKDASVSEKNADALRGILALPGDFASGLLTLSNLSDDEECKKAVEELKNLFEGLNEMGFGKNVRLDFSIANDLDYYTGIVFQGYGPGAHRAVLSGGRYDGLTEKFRRGVGAMGFALYLNDLNTQTASKKEADAIIVYEEGASAVQIMKKAQELREKGLVVAVEKKGADISGYAICVEVKKEC